MLADAISGFSLQAVVDLKTGLTIYREMLVRFRDNRNVQEAILAAEADRTVHTVDLAILASAVGLLMQSSERSAVAVNLSPVTIEQYSEQITKLVLPLGELARFLIFEITETAPILLPVAFKTFIGAMLALGVRFAADDFGTGFCDTARVMFLRAKYIKVPKSGPFGWARMLPAHRAAMNELALEHAAITIAEGVETAADLQDVRELGIEGAQGYFFGKPNVAKPGDQALFLDHHGARWATVA